MLVVVLWRHSNSDSCWEGCSMAHTRLRHPRRASRRRGGGVRRRRLRCAAAVLARAFTCKAIVAGAAQQARTTPDTVGCYKVSQQITVQSAWAAYGILPRFKLQETAD
jgi:hypothetical protein